MIEMTATQELLARAIDVSALRQSVYASNIANSGVEGYRRMEVSFARELERIDLQMGAGRSAFDGSSALGTSAVVATQDAVKLDEEVALMAKNALLYQVLLGAYQKSFGNLQLAIREGRQ
jgi:flagellar basal-body rod protein FlgB